MSQAPSPQQQQLQQTYAINIASFLYGNSVLKQRSGELQGKGAITFFRFKRVVRALLSDDYKTRSANPKNQLPPIASEEQAKAAFVLLIKSQLVIPGQKLHTAEAREKNLKPKKGSPSFLPLQRAELTPDEYYIWFYKKKSIKEIALGVGIVVGVLALILFPLWPIRMRQGVVYISQFVLGLFALLIVTAIVRLILYVLSLPLLKHGFWLFPNLFADVGFFDSFKPLYGFDEDKKDKKKKKKSTEAAAEAKAETETETSAISSEKTGTEITTSSAKPNESTTTKRKAYLEEIDD